MLCLQYLSRMFATLFSDAFPDIRSPRVHLRLMKPEDIDWLLQEVKSPELWSHFPSDLSTEAGLCAWMDTALLQYRQKTRVPFVIIETATDRVVGCTSFGNLSERDARLEIGWTWLGKRFHRTGLNQQAKYALLDFAFNHLGCERVEFKTDVLNEASRQALLRLGATEEGVLRSHTLMPGNRRRDTIYYSILKDEWPSFTLR